MKISEGTMSFVQTFFEKILVLASDAVLAPVGQEVMGITRCESEVTGTLMVLEQN